MWESSIKQYEGGINLTLAQAKINTDLVMQTNNDPARRSQGGGADLRAAGIKRLRHDERECEYLRQRQHVDLLLVQQRHVRRCVYERKLLTAKSSII